MTKTGRTSVRLLALAGIGVALAGCGGLDADGRFREDPIGGLEQRVIGNTLSSVGLTPRARERIDYTPRAPLAMPPRGPGERPLRPPADSVATIETNPNWPRDPDEMRRRAAAREAGRVPDSQFERERDGRRLTAEERETQDRVGPMARRPDPRDQGIRDSNHVLGREDLERGWEAPVGGIFRPDETVDVTGGREEGQGSARREIDRQAGATQRGAATSQRMDTTRLAGQEPPRRTLADPPPGFRTPAADPTGGRIAQEDLDRRSLWDRLWNRN